MAWGAISGVMTAILIVLFVAVFVWAFWPQHKRRFDEASQLALDEEDRDISIEEMEQRE